MLAATRKGFMKDLGLAVSEMPPTERFARRPRNIGMRGRAASNLEVGRRVILLAAEKAQQRWSGALQGTGALTTNTASHGSLGAVG